MRPLLPRPDDTTVVASRIKVDQLSDRHGGVPVHDAFPQLRGWEQRGRVSSRAGESVAPRHEQGGLDLPLSARAGAVGLDNPIARHMAPPTAYFEAPDREVAPARLSTPPGQWWAGRAASDDAFLEEERQPATLHTAVKVVRTLAVLASLLLIGSWAWTRIGTNLVAEQAQKELAESLPIVGSQYFAPSTTGGVAIAEPTQKALEPLNFDPGVEGSAMATLSIPAIGLEQTIVHGVAPRDLDKGPGWMDGTALPGAPGNAVLSGHRTTHGGPFRHLDELKNGDKITVSVPGHAPSVFEVRSIFVVKPGDVWVANATDGVRLTMTTCHPEGSDKQRLVVQAELVSGESLSYATPAATWQASTPG